MHPAPLVHVGERPTDARHRLTEFRQIGRLPSIQSRAVDETQKHRVRRGLTIATLQSTAEGTADVRVIERSTRCSCWIRAMTSASSASLVEVNLIAERSPRVESAPSSTPRRASPASRASTRSPNRRVPGRSGSSSQTVSCHCSLNTMRSTAGPAPAPNRPRRDPPIRHPAPPAETVSSGRVPADLCRWCGSCGPRRQARAAASSSTSTS